MTAGRLGFKLFSGVSDGGKNSNLTVLEAVKQRSYIDGTEGGIWGQESGSKPPLNIFLYYIYLNPKYMFNNEIKRSLLRYKVDQTTNKQAKINHFYPTEMFLVKLYSQLHYTSQ